MVANPASNLSGLDNTPEQRQPATPIELVTCRKQPNIIELVETVHTLQHAYRPISKQERDLLASWSGWGPYREAFELYPKDKWQIIAPQLRKLLGEDGFQAASAATPTSFFTSPYISRALWNIAQGLGFSGGNVLEPGCGTGQVLSYAPASLQLNITGIEMEPFTASIAQLLFPEANIITGAIQETALVNDAFDLCIGNVPFSEVSIYDRSLPFKERLSLHNYCIYRGLQALRPGGIAILVTSRYTMDSLNYRTREILSQFGMLLGAIRLPSYGHKWAKTAVITDILVLQRRYPGCAWYGHDWVTQKDLEINAISIGTNSYFYSHPQQILGTPSYDRGMHYKNELVIKAPIDLEGALDTAIQTIIAEADRHNARYIPRIDRTKLSEQLLVIRKDGLREGCFYLLDDQGLIQIVNGEQKPVARLVPELTAIVRIRDAALALLEAERDYARSDESLMPLRLELNRLYDAYVTQYKHLRRSTVTRRKDKETGEETVSRRLASWTYAFRTDEHYPLLLGLEVYNDETEEIQKAPIFFQRVNHPVVYKETAESREEAIALSLDRFGFVNYTFIAKATGKAEADVPEFLGDLVFEDPESKKWEIAPTYLSGNVRRKLEVARQALTSDPKWQRNVDALAKVQPDPIPPDEITVLLGAPWIPVEYISQFCYEVLKAKVSIARDQISGAWYVAQPPGLIQYSAEATSTWGTGRVNAFRLLEHLLNHKQTRVEDDDGTGKKYINQDETLLAQQKRRELQNRFGEWVWEELERTKKLAELYNKLYNGVVPSNFSGDHLSFPGMDAYWQKHLYPWQRDFIARMINNRSGLCAFPVGAGKTKIQVAGAMTLKRMQLISKAAILVPNHLLEQIASEAKQLYPGADILMLSRDDLSSENRRIFMARIATGNHDLIVMTHSAFEAINVHPDTKSAYIKERIQQYKQVLYSINQQSQDNAEKRKIKQIEKQLQQMEENLKELLDIKRDPGITFEQLGISYLIVDEAHFFKNLGLPTNQEKLTVTPSQRAQDMLMKLRWLEKNNGNRPFASFFTATPISNSMVEAFVMLWYLNYGLLKEYELFNVDDFSSMFIESEAKVEVTPNGAGFRMYERPTKFVNLPEFMHLFASVADIRPPDILADKRPDLLEHTIPIEPTEKVLEYVDSLVERSETLKVGVPHIIDGKLDNMLWVTTDGRKAALWLGLLGIKEQYPAKLDAVAAEMAKVYHRWQEKAVYLTGAYKSLQIGFCDIGTPSKEKGDQVYGVLKQLLIEKGVPAKGIRFIHEVAGSDIEKADLFEKCRAGEVAILLGSTSKLGTGTNIQTRCAAIHHIDAPWRPDEVEQRLGRGQRPGNLYPVVECFYYVQRRTFDAYSWQILANKAKFFNQMRSTTVVSREMEYSDDSSLTYGQVKAAATGDILLLEHANISLVADSLDRLHISFKRARERDKQEAASLRRGAEDLEPTLLRYQSIQKKVAAYTGTPFMTPSRTSIEKEEDIKAFVAKEVKTAVDKQAYSHRIGYWNGVAISFTVNTLSRDPYAFYFGDYQEGIRDYCPPSWLDKDRTGDILSNIQKFIADVPREIALQTQRIAEWKTLAENFEQSSLADFPQQQALLDAFSRKSLLDAYINLAAKATEDKELQKLAEMRRHLLDTAPKELMERPKPKNTALFVLPPRDPNAQPATAAKTPEAEKIIVQGEEAKELSIAEVARSIKQNVARKTTTQPAPVFGHVEKQRREPEKGKKDTRTKEKGTHPSATLTLEQAIREGECRAPAPISRPIPTTPQQHQSKSALIFGNPAHIQLTRQRSKKANQSTSKKQLNQPDFPACGVLEEPVQRKAPRGLVGAVRQHTLWELIESTGT